jgi:hypothetical protein
MAHFHIVIDPIHPLNPTGPCAEVLEVMFRHSNERKKDAQSCIVSWVRPDATHPWMSPRVSLAGDPTTVVESACMVAIVERWSKRLKSGMNDANLLITEILKKNGDQAVWSETHQEYIPVKKLEQNGKKWRAVIAGTSDVLVVVDAPDESAARRIAGQRLLSLSQEHPETEKPRFIAWLSGGEKMEEVQQKDAPRVVPLTVLLPVAADAKAPATKAKK